MACQAGELGDTPAGTAPGSLYVLVSPDPSPHPGVPPILAETSAGPTSTPGPSPVQRALGVGLEMGVLPRPAAVHFGSSLPLPLPLLLKTAEEEAQSAP